MNKKLPNKNQTFLHDLVNHTHSLLLYLNQKKRNGLIELKEINQLISEIKLMQSFIQDECNYQHRDVSTPERDADLSEILKLGQSLLSAYFSDESITLITNLEEIIVPESCDFRFNSVLFFRVLSNIVKNIYEAGPTIVEISFAIDDRGILKVETKNDFKPKVNPSDRISPPIGMFSIRSLVESVGGAYEVSVNENWWINSISIPLLLKNENPIKVA